MENKCKHEYEFIHIIKGWDKEQDLYQCEKCMKIELTEVGLTTKELMRIAKSRNKNETQK